MIGREFPGARLVILGKDLTVGASGRPLSQEVAGVLDPAVRPRVLFAGGRPRSEVAAYLRRAHLCCYPSKIESFGLAPVEAMATGKPTIFTRSGSGAEIIEDGISGLLCDPESPGDIAEKIRLILQNPELAARLGNAARARVADRFNRSKWIPKNIAFYEETLLSHGKPKNGARVTSPLREKTNSRKGRPHVVEN
jgi:glycosyltransferase involved in cell wall biosynthesis